MEKTVETHLNKQNSGEKVNALCHNTSRIKKIIYTIKAINLLFSHRIETSQAIGRQETLKMNVCLNVTFL